MYENGRLRLVAWSSECTISVYAGHVLSWKVDGEEQLFVRLVDFWITKKHFFYTVTLIQSFLFNCSILLSKLNHYNL